MPGFVKRSTVLVMTVVVLVAAPAAVAAKEIFKVATLAPQGSLWDTTLRELGDRWSRASGGEVQLRLYPGGVAGDETDVVRKMRIGQFQGAALTVTGLAEIEPSFNLFQIPLLVDSWAELDAVLGELRPELERRLAEKGYVLLLWGHGGWVHLFSREPIRSVGDLKKQKLFVWAGNDALVQQWRAGGFQPVPLAATDVTMGFQTGMIDVVPTTPIAALTLQWYRQTPYMQGLGLAPLVGGVIVRRDAWLAVPEAKRVELAAAARESEGILGRQVPAQDAGAVEQMKARGLEVIEVSPDQRAEWRAAADRFAGEARAAKVPAEILATARAAIDRFRAAESSP